MSVQPAVPDAAPIIYTLFRNTGGTRTYELSETWPEIVARVESPHQAAAKEHLPLISMGVYGHQKSPNGSLRHQKNLRVVTGVEGDYDAGIVGLEDAAERLAMAGIRCVLYTTPSHTAERPRWRVLAPLSHEYPPLARTRYVARLNGILGGILTGESFTLTQSFYLGRVTGKDYQVIPLEGDCIDTRDEFDAHAITPPGKSVADGGRRDETTDDELRAAIRSGTNLHESLRGLSSRLVGRGMPVDDAIAALEGLMAESSERGTERWNQRHAEIPRLVSSAASKFADPRAATRLRVVGPEDFMPPVDDAIGEPPDIELPPIEAYAGEGDVTVAASTTVGPMHKEPSKLHWIGDLQLRVTVREIVKSLLGAGALSVVYGDSNTGKTFFALDLAAHVAEGLNWRGRRVQQGLVVYIAGEGYRSVENRAIAHREHRLKGKTIPLAIYPDAINFLEQGADMVHLMCLIREAEECTGLKLALLIVDTLARAMPGGEENGTEDMGAVVAHADWIRSATGAHVMFIHHSGKDSSRGARGNSCLRAAVDTEIEVSGSEGTRTAKVTKQRDHATGDTFGFDLEVVSLGFDEDGDEIRTCLLQPTDVAPSRRFEPIGKNQQLMLGAVRQYVAEHGEMISTPVWHTLCRAQGMAKSRWAETRTALCNAGWLIETIGGVRYEA